MDAEAFLRRVGFEGAGADEHLTIFGADNDTASKREDTAVALDQAAKHLSFLIAKKGLAFFRENLGNRLACGQLHFHVGIQPRPT